MDLDLKSISREVKESYLRRAGDAFKNLAASYTPARRVRKLSAEDLDTSVETIALFIDAILDVDPCECDRFPASFEDFVAEQAEDDAA